MTLLSEARTYLKINEWSVLPLHPNKKMPDAVALASRGYKNDEGKGSWKPLQLVRPTEDDLTAWFEGKPRNVGVVTGKVSGIIVLDIDGPTGEETVNKFGELPTTPMSQTGNGKQVYFKHPGYELANLVKVLPGLDLRGDGGFVVAPPSIHPNGKQYKWLVEPWVGLAEMPAWLVEATTRQLGATEQAPKLVGGSPYGVAALQRELTAVASAANGTRNDQLNRSAYALGQLVAGGELPEAQVVETLSAAAKAAGLTAQEVHATILSGLTKGKESPRSAPNHLTELGNAQRFVKEFGAMVRYVPEQDAWVIWNGQRWQYDNRMEVIAMGKAIPQIILAEAQRTMDAERREKIVKWSMTSEGRSKLENMITLARSEPGIPVSQSDLDADGWQLNVINGTINLRTGELGPHRKEDLITKLAPVQYVPEYPTPIWDAFIAKIFGEQQDVIRFVKQAVGYSLTGDVSAQVLFFLFGTGQNGKTTFVETIKQMLGDYAQKAPAELVTNKAQTSGSQDLFRARLAGTRFVLTSEMEEDVRMAESIVKDLTGADTIVARHLYQKPFEFQPTHKLWMYGNHKPLVRGTDEGIWRRIRLIPFEVQIPEKERDDTLLDRLKDEWPGILNWAIEGLKDWRASGFIVPKSVKSATGDYRDEMDTLGEFLEEHTKADPDLQVKGRRLYEVYQIWATDGGMRPMTSVAFGRKLRERGFSSYKSNGLVFYRGLDFK